jgi:hypothetical protein
MKLALGLWGEDKLAKAAIIVIFLALIRCLAETFRLQAYSPVPLSFAQVSPYLVGALLAAVALLLMTVSLFYHRHRVVVALATLTIIGLLLVKALLLS